MNQKPTAPKNLRGLKKEFKNITSWTAGDTRFMAKALMFIAEQHEKLIKQNRKESDGSVFIKYMIRFKKMSFIEALNLWKDFSTKEEES